MKRDVIRRKWYGWKKGDPVPKWIPQSKTKLSRSPKVRRISDDKIYALYAEGYSYAIIAKEAGVSRQRIQQIIRPAQSVVSALMRRAQGRCERCGIILSSGHVHHKEKDGLFGSNGLDVLLSKLLYLCPSCHRTVHRKKSS